MDAKVQTEEQVDAATESFTKEQVASFYILWGFVFTLFLLGMILESVKKLRSPRMPKQESNEQKTEENVA
ncbi:Oidioi.mRNA.OKI2018_I69.chr2.g5641.t1.cds [Oikopleura dioica]|uniref:Oidioi.mRNA.OKI2018_I69.chr2.g5641.t1.cds n=1 Tax=Oikopleura dioica TaxID=34765 RepID=A0ABN7T0G7_OIKDI|nr:Oidioi.mRNA.OKI2018_I69.chr2.g5641.t1.cds [Oikopleura dioica]